MLTRLESIAPEIQIEIERLELPERERLALRIASWAVERVGAENEQLRVAVSAGISSIAEQVASMFDDQYFVAQQKAASDSLLYFSRARAVSSIVFAIEKNPVEAIYEALIATDDIATIHAFFD